MAPGTPSRLGRHALADGATLTERLRREHLVVLDRDESQPGLHERLASTGLLMAELPAIGTQPLVLLFMRGRASLTGDDVTPGA